MTRPHPYGALLRKQRVDAGLSLRDVAAKLGVSHVFLADVERGARGPLNQEHEPKLLKLLKSLNQHDLDVARKESKAIKITLDTTPEPYHDLTVALARRYESGEKLRETQVNRIIKILRGDED